MKPESFPVYEQVVLSGQMSDRQVQDLLAAEPEFADWIRRRATERQEAPQ